MARTTNDPRKMVSVRLTQTIIDKIEALAKESGLSKSDIISIAVSRTEKNIKGVNNEIQSRRICFE